MGIKPENYVVVEYSNAGVDAAKSGRKYAIAVAAEMCNSVASIKRLYNLLGILVK